MKFDLTGKLTAERPVLVIRELELEVDNTKDAMLAFDEKMESLPPNAPAMELHELAVRHFLGEDALEKLDALHLSAPDWGRVFIGIMALVNEEDYDTVEARFQPRN